MSVPRRGPDVFINREVSWLDFNARVLEEACDPSTPLLERTKFAAIVASNLDEFFMVRVAGLKDAIARGALRPDPAGLTPVDQLEAIGARVREMVAALYRSVGGDLLPTLASRGIRIVRVADLGERGRAAAAAFFRDEILPVLTPLAIDLGRPFPMLASLTINLAVRFTPVPGTTTERVAVVPVPARLPRLVRVTDADGDAFVCLEDVIGAELGAIFAGQTVMESAAFRLARDSELELDDEGGDSYLETIEEELRKRRRSAVVRLEIEAAASDLLVALLGTQFSVERADVYRVESPLDLRMLFAIADLPGHADLRDDPMPPVPLLEPRDEREIFRVLDSRDLLLHHPYDSFDPVVALVETAADDPQVVAIKQTLYRSGGDSPIVDALTRAADQGKQVTVVVELMARFDEQQNIRWARRLEEAGAHVIYGIRGYKVHAKVCLVVRRTDAGLRYYTHLGTGNYNERTARLYTDMGLMTADPAIGADASSFFSALTGYSDPPRLKKLVMAPTMLRDRFLKLIARERDRAEAGQPAGIRAKMNSLVDPVIVDSLYRAAAAGVRIRLNVRGVCVLRPGVPGLSESIEVVSVVGRFLEHARVYAFRNGGDEEVYLASADWMPRNLDRRVELMFPIEAPECRRKVLVALQAMFDDNVKGRRLGPDGRWQVPPRPPGVDPLSAQAWLHEWTERQHEQRRQAGQTFVPIRSGPTG